MKIVYRVVNPDSSKIAQLVKFFDKTGVYIEEPSMIRRWAKGERPVREGVGWVDFLVIDNCYSSFSYSNDCVGVCYLAEQIIFFSVRREI